MADVHDFVAELADDQLDTPSLCGGWTVMEVAAHLASFVGVPVWGLPPTRAKCMFLTCGRRDYRARTV
jgi:hypothetical protein